MNLDIAPYTADEADSLGRSLTNLGVPSFGPAVGVKLLEIAAAVKGLTTRSGVTHEMRAVMLGFHARLLDVARVGHGQASEVIEKLERLTKANVPAGKKGGSDHGS